MAYIQKGMTIKCRTKEEVAVFIDIATAEGHLWGSGESLLKKEYCSAPMSFQVGLFGDNRYPEDITYSTNVNFTDDGMTPIEASQLFRNILISRRIKAVKCRTPEEVAIYEEIARAEGYRMSSTNRVELSGAQHRVYVTNYDSGSRFPNDIGYTSNVDYVDSYPGQCTIIVEASKLFHNQLISRRKKHEQSMGV